MNQRSLIEQLDSAIDAMLANRAASGAALEAENEPLFVIARDLRGQGPRAPWVSLPCSVNGAVSR